MSNEHTLYTNADVDGPIHLCDRNGDVVLAQCKTCGMAEVELIGACEGRRSEPDECAANGSTGHSFGAHGPSGERQCAWCGESAT